MTLTLTRQMISAEILRLRRNRGLMAFALLLSAGVVVLVFGFTAIEHLSDPAKYGPAGGTDAFDRAVRMLGVFFGALSAILIGAEAGTADLSSGVFRDLVATGRSRLMLFAVRVPAAVLVSLCFAALGYALALVGTFALAGGLPTPSLALMLQAAGWIVLANAILTTLAVGVGSLTGSRALTLTAVIGWQAVATNLLLNVTALGSARDSLLTAALDQVMPVSASRDVVTMSTGIAVMVLAAWVAVPIAVGAWRTQTRDA